LNAYQRTAALNAAIDLDLFTGIAEGRHTPSRLAAYCKGSERGVRILCDYLLTNFLHHFSRPDCVSLLRGVRAALKPSGRLVTLEFVPNEDRVSPPIPAAFSLIMLAETPAGDAYTFSQLNEMFKAAGFGSSKMVPVPNSPQTAIVTRAS
jgi:hypothetical protein